VGTDAESAVVAAGAGAGAAAGRNPNQVVVVNAVLETFVQSDGIGCFSCHQGATVARSGELKPPFASSYSFVFGRAKSPK